MKSNSPNVDIAKIEKDYEFNERLLKEKRNLYGELLGDIGAINTLIDNAQKTIHSLSVTSEKNKRIQKYILYSEAIFRYFDKEYKKKETEVKESLLESVNRIFQEMYHGERTVSINDKYQIVLSAQLSTGTKATDESSGLEIVKNFSFIAGLVDLARQKMQPDTSSNVDSELEKELHVVTEPYPLVMDAPFSNADEIHINNISSIIPDIAEQVILIVMRKDWKFAQEALA
jgi:DNA sulfur modification protein DndD